MADVTQANKRVVERFYRAFCARDWPSMRALMADDATYWIAGRTEASGVIAGADTYIAFVSGVFGKTVGPLVVDLGPMTAEGDRVAVEAVSHATFVNGYDYANELHLLVTLRGGKVASVREYLDTQRVIETLDSLKELGVAPPHSRDP